MSEAVAELVDVQGREASLLSPLTDGLVHTAPAEHTTLSEPKLRSASHSMHRPDAEVSVQCLSGLPPEWDDADATALPEKRSGCLDQVDVIHLQRRQLGTPDAGIHEQTQERRVPTCEKALAVAGFEQST